MAERALQRLHPKAQRILWGSCRAAMEHQRLPESQCHPRRPGQSEMRTRRLGWKAHGCWQWGRVETCGVEVKGSGQAVESSQPGKGVQVCATTVAALLKSRQSSRNLDADVYISAASHAVVPKLLMHKFACNAKHAMSMDVSQATVSSAKQPPEPPGGRYKKSLT